MFFAPCTVRTFTYFYPLTLIKPKFTTMKKMMFSMFALLLFVSVSSCRESTESKTKDTMEDTADDVGDAVDDAGDAVKDAADDVGDAVDDATDDNN